MTSPTTIHPGQQITLQATFQILTGGLWVNTDPATVLFYIKSPTQEKPTLATYGTDVDVARASVGVYTYAVIPHVPGQWIYGYESTGSGAAARESSFWVESSALYT